MSARAVDDAPARIVAVATRLFTLHGYNGVSYLDIARELGTTHSKIHYYFRTKDLLAEAVLRGVADRTLAAMREIWARPDASLHERLLGTRDWIHRQYLEFNPEGQGGRSWGLLARFTLDADSLTPSMRKLIRATLEKLDEYVAAGVRAAIERGELVPDAPADGIALQIAAVLSVTGQLTRRASGFERLHELLRWTYVGIVRAYGRSPRHPLAWPELGRRPTQPRTAARRPALPTP